MATISKKRVCQTIDKAGSEIEVCWRMLSEFRSRTHHSIVAEIVKLQGKLTGAIWLLDDLYRDIHAERRRLIGMKGEFDQSWFRKRMACLASYQKAIRHAISIVQTVGDGFAWIFYAEERELIDKHLRLPRQLHLPPKIGRTGERAFVEKLQVFEGKLVIYHGITSFLRMGDVSFYDFDQKKITNIGELKTEHLGGDQYRVNLGFVYGGRFSPVVDINKVVPAAPGRADISALHRQKLGRQLKNIAKAIAPDKIRIEQQKITNGKFYFEELQVLLETCNSRGMKFNKVGRGLAIASLRLHGSGSGTLAKRLISDRKFHVGKKLDTAIVAAQSIVDPALTDNSLLVSSLGANERGIPGLMSGTAPIFWWPIDSKQLYDLIFGNVIAITLFNPAPFWQLLRTKGFELSIGDRAQVISANINVGQRIARLHNIRYFETLITHHLMSEDDVVSIIESALTFPVPEGVSVRIDISPQIRLP